MVDPDAPLYQNKPEVWDAKKCAKMAKRTAKDGYGTKYHFKGFIGTAYGPVRYNGGISKDGKWWQGENFPLPIIDSAYEIVCVPTWGLRIKLKE